MTTTGSHLTLDAMLRLILNSRVYDVAEETSLEPATRLSARLRNQVLLKREDLQPVFSYKLRGAYNRIAHLTAAEREALQKRVELLHKHWTKDREYLPPPTVGSLADLDPAVLVTPPKGLEIGYVPIVTRQGEKE